ncbi:Membrane proteins related to metalloendopeptidases [Nocardioides sp. J9]|nr:Membrane proteins related to metalloendopeptidases [Nocardioides sp. J9]
MVSGRANSGPGGPVLLSLRRDASPGPIAAGSRPQDGVRRRVVHNPLPRDPVTTGAGAHARTVHPSRRPALVLLALTALSLLLLLLLPAPPGRAAPGDDPVGEWPLRPRPEVVDRFDPPAVPWGAGHRGVDLAARPGQVVHAALPGRVAFAGRIAGRGVVTVSHGDTRTTYEPVAATVEVGDLLPAGAPLGRLELAGSHCFPRACLHWGWLRGETYLDPLRLVGAGPVRLLPLWRDAPWPLPAGLRPAGAPAGRPGGGGRW